MAGPRRIAGTPEKFVKFLKRRIARMFAAACGLLPDILGGMPERGQRDPQAP